MLALTFADEKDYDGIQQNDRISLVGLSDLRPGKPVQMLVKSDDGQQRVVMLDHTFNEEQVQYFRAGSVLNVMANNSAKDALPNKLVERSIAEIVSIS